MLFYLVFSIILIFYFFFPRSKWENSVLLFVAFIIQGGILTSENQLFGLIDHRTLVAFMLIFSASASKNIIVNNRLDFYKSSSLFLGVFIIIFLNRYIEIKDGLLFGGGYREEFEGLITLKRVVRDSINYFAIYLIMKRMSDYRTLEGLENGLLLGLVMAVVSMNYIEFFVKAGFNLNLGIDIGQEESVRSTGFLFLNANNASSIFNIVYGYILAKSDKQTKMPIKYLIMIALVTVGILVVASKTGFVIFIFLTIIYFYRSLHNPKKFFIYGFWMFLIGLVLFYYLGDFMAERARMQLSGESDSLGPREGYWKLYLNDIYENLNYLLIGNVGMPTYHRSPHNTYIHYLFFTGVIPVIIIIRVFWQMFKKRLYFKDNLFYYTPLYSLIAVILSWVTGAGSINYWFVLIIAASAGIVKRNTVNIP